jgi:uncharacterized protein with PIN domain
VTTAEFRFYAELNTFIAPKYRHLTFTHNCPPDATLKHMIEALGVPHTEVELILVNGKPEDFSCRVQQDMRISVYPHFNALNISPWAVLQSQYAQEAKFIADAHLGLLAKNLRMLGFDVLYRNSYSDAEVARTARLEDRIVLTRDRDLLIRKDIVRGCYLHSTVCDEQLCEVFARFNLAPAVRAFSRCLACNGLIHAIDKQDVIGRVPETSGQHYSHFFECEGCSQIYWNGSHVMRMRRRVEQVLQQCGVTKHAGLLDET